MQVEAISRRHFMVNSAAALGVLAPPVLAAERQTITEEAPMEVSMPERALKVVCVGAHPDDPESGCAGTLARYAAAGHRVTVVYLTRGERGIRGKSLEEAAAIRTAEAEAACKIIGAVPVFAGQIDGATEVNRAWVESLAKLLAAEEPDIVFTHWPLDTHMDHQVTSLLTFRAYLSAPRRFRLYFFEVNTGSQTQGFAPTIYVDIAPTREKKKAALFAHKSQDGEGIYREHHALIETWRGREAGVAAAEAFVPLARDSREHGLPGLERLL